MKYRPSFDVTDIGELARIDKALQECGETAGIKPYLTELIARLTSGGIGIGVRFGDQRLVQAKRLWNKGWGRRLHIKSFRTYLASIPEIPDGLAVHDPEFPLLVLVDPRLGLSESCQIIGIEFEWPEQDAVPCDDRHATPKMPFWVRMHDGRKNRHYQPSDCRAECTDTVYAGTDMVGIMTYLHYPGVVKEGEHTLDLPGSVLRGDGDCAVLQMSSNGPWFGPRCDDNPNSECGTGCFRRE